MKLLSAKLKGLIGICRASGLREINIDFTRCRHKIILIIGENGSGKSTIMNALHPFPDPQSNYLPHEEGLKQLQYITDDGVIYNIRIEYPLTRTGDRATTKAYIEKIVDGTYTELNPNGNIGSYKDILYSEFRLDSNFVALSQLSVENRGLVEMTPAERKKFVGNIIDATEVYNNIYKTLNKRSTIFKSMINTIITKIDAIGNEENLLSTIDSMQSRIDSLQLQQDQLTKQLSDHEAKIHVLDPNHSIQDTYTLYYNQNQSVKSQLETINFFLNSLKDKSYYLSVDSKERCEIEIKRLTNEVNKLDIELSTNKNRINDLLIKREEESKTISLKINRLNSLTSEHNYMDLIKEIDRLKGNIEIYLKQFKDIGVTPETALTKDEFVIGLNTLKLIKDQVDIILSYNYDIEFKTAVYNIKEGINCADDIIKLKDQIQCNEQYMSKLNEDIKYNEGLLDRLNILDKRPSTCKEDNCSFIRDALEIQRKNPSNEIDRLSQILIDTGNNTNNKRDTLESLQRIMTVMNNLTIIIRYINSNKSILDKLPNGYIFSNIDVFLDKLLSGSTFNEINDLYKYVDSANIFEQYRLDTNTLIRLESEYKIYQSKNEIIDEIQNDIDTINKNLDNLLSEIQSTQSLIKDIETQIIEKKDLINKFTSILEKYSVRESLEVTLRDNNNKLQEISNSVAAIENSIKAINQINSSLLNIKNELSPSIQDMNKLKYSYERLLEYKEELKIYQSKYDYIELVKKYSSPTKSGIQNLFIKVYMGQTLNIANNLLSMLFKGSLQLSDYTINDKEFKIPCKSLESPIVNDDISSCSTAQKCMISMILSFALLQQGSTKYNILRLDEIDGGLDQENRANFLIVLEKIIDIMNVQNCLMVSHSSENVLENTDIILLNPVGSETPNGNIIFSYSEERY